MSERILRALMQLFAIVAKVDEVQEENSDEVIRIHSTRGREIIRAFLKSELSSYDVEQYLTFFDNYLNETRGKAFNKAGGRKRTSLQSVKILRICEQINTELTQRQKFIVLIRVIEFTITDNKQTQKEQDFIKTVADSFRISEADFNGVNKFIQSSAEEIIESNNYVYYSGDQKLVSENQHVNYFENLNDLIQVYHIEPIKTLFFKYFGNDELYINGLLTSNDKVHLFNIGSTVRTTLSAQLFYSDVISKLNKSDDIQPLLFEVNNVTHSFKGKALALHEVNFKTNQGKLIGIMGGSGTGKSTLLNILNGKIKPKTGHVRINGIDVHHSDNELNGIIGNIPQADTLIEELTVFENLYFSAKLSLGDLNDAQIKIKVIKILKRLGLYEIRRLKVGSVLQKVISGGQRKRLNIALELIREPSILFVDEPTSGLSSRDSENIMDLLKELTLSGKLVFVVIHQPSSNIFKLFDRLLITDEGGYIVYDGIPLNALVHFKTYAYRGNAEERECTQCGNVNPEQIFELIDAKIVDEYGNETKKRKKDPKDWNKLYLKYSDSVECENVSQPPKSETFIPKKFTQLKAYLQRDVKSKISNNQYVITNLLIAPLLAFILAFCIKFFGIENGVEKYTFFENQNIPQFIFISVIVSIFLGLTVAAEEINRDKSVLAREEFLHLSRQSYLISKIVSVFGISAIQSFLFVLISHYILEIEGMLFYYWFMLFTASAVSNVVGLNISSAFNSAKVIYIIIPLMIIPQLLFSGAIVEFNKLHPLITDTTKVPAIGNVMISRWAYEGLAVQQQTQNKLEQRYLIPKCEMNTAEWNNDYWLPALNNHVSVAAKGPKHPDFERSKEIVINEIEKADEIWNGVECKDCLIELKAGNKLSSISRNKIDEFLRILKLQNISTITKQNDSIQLIISRIGTSKFKELKSIYTNSSLEDLLNKRTELNKIIELNGHLYQNDVPAYKLPQNTDGMLDAQFYTPYKNVFGKRYQTYWVNIIVLWLFALGAYIALYFDWLKKLLYSSVRYYNARKKRKASN